MQGPHCAPGCLCMAEWWFDFRACSTAYQNVRRIWADVRCSPVVREFAENVRGSTRKHLPRPLIPDHHWTPPLCLDLLSNSICLIPVTCLRPFVPYGWAVHALIEHHVHITRSASSRSVSHTSGIPDPPAISNSTSRKSARIHCPCLRTAQASFPHTLSMALLHRS